ncbi:hypothetical protein [Methylorubrum extorquens]|uniref:hypothetical protein n=1 Tax=Methylorubrum extorquens TaxID=408 RepID=UPI00223883EF|nr:hypothetical protein [Methylorubrum extorquens]UYW34473.1 hypothetical protein OKB92_10445 [Methylorubrum extorquens]
MAGFNYARARRTADRLITRFGGPGELRRDAEPNDGDMTNGLTPEPGAASDEKHPCTLVVVDYSDEERKDSLITQGDRRALIATKGLTVRPDESFSLVLFADPEPYQIVSCKPLSPAGTDVLYDAQVRR